jgi:hypothetical protein
MFLDRLTPDLLKRHESNFTKLSFVQAMGNSPSACDLLGGPHTYHLLPSGLEVTTYLAFHDICMTRAPLQKLTLIFPIGKTYRVESLKSHTFPKSSKYNLIWKECHHRCSYLRRGHAGVG